MECYSFYRFDHARFVALRPALRSATTPAAFAALAETPETEALVTALLEDAITVQEARSAFVQEVCCLGDPLSLGKGLPRFVAALARRRGAEDAAELLGELLAGKRNREPWFSLTSGLIGFLTPEETQALHRSYSAFALQGRLRMPSAGKRRRARRGGLVGACVGFFSHLLDRDPKLDDMQQLLGDLIEEAACNGEGIAAIVA